MKLRIPFAYNERDQEENQPATTDKKGHLQTNRSTNHLLPGLASSRLHSWKEIAAFFNRDVRTVRRWEIERKMPVYRVPGGPRSGVYAYVNELERWLRDDGGRSLTEQQCVEMRHLSTVEVVLPAAPERSSSKDPAPSSPISVPGAHERGHWISMALKLALGIACCLAVVWFLRAHHVASTSLQGFTHAGLREDVEAPEAQDLYLRGRYFWNLRTEEGVKQGLALFSKAADQDPHFAAAYAGIADSYILIRQYGHMPDSQAFPLALKASQRALALDANSFEGHRSYAFVLNYWMWNFHAAEDEFRKVIALRPDDALGHHWYATSLYSNGRFHDALEEIEIARQLQPESIAILANRDLLLAQMDQQAAFTDLLLLEDANPSFPPIHSYLAEIHLTRGELKQYLEESWLAASLSGDAQRAQIIQHAQSELAARGSRATLLRLADGYADLADREFPDAMTPAFLYARLGEKQRALHYLTLACGRHESSFLRVGYDKAFTSLSTDVTFQNLLRRRNTPMGADGPSTSSGC
ncbi:Tfp pilus assembly protein PilF [Granulicella pectinivorans]|uniref:Tfp pilus assembly protein PilF n=1 Tax=Granulicella pectinivorans TaxID=474950 RepID=A0A1I6MM86_9BACT|nr:hypothetical protein [Granulicella pectinivorans]SFS16707.1 Tfp pilus assembly protein PilF [Granulicella pectinivorans]